MKKFEYILGIAAIALSLAACTKTGQNYEPNPPYPGDNVFFPQDLNTKIELPKDATFFQVPLLRSANIDKAAAITIEATGPAIDEGYVLAPTGALFEENKDTSLVYFLVDAEKLGLNKEVSFTVTITDPAAVTPYGESSATFKVSIPLPWLKFDSGVMYETPYWGEEEKKTLYYQEIADTLRYCRIPECFGYETIKGGGTYDVQDYCFYWNTKTNAIYIPKQYMGYTNDNGKTWFLDEPEYYNWYWNTQGKGYGYAEGTAEWFAFCDSFRAQYPEDYYPYYDGNGVFRLADMYVAGEPGTDLYLGDYVWYDKTGQYDSFVCDSFEHFDYTTTLEYAGMFVGTDGVACALVDFTAGADVAGVKYVVTDQTITPDVTLMAIVSGSVTCEDVTIIDGKAQVRPVLEKGSYRVVAVPYNSNGELQFDTATHVDFFFPGLDGSKWEGITLGSYSMIDATALDVPSEAVFTISSADGGEDNYLITPLTYAGDTFEWKGVYNKTANTLTLDGGAVGYESYGSLWLYSIFSISGYSAGYWSGNTGGEPLVFNVDPETKEISGLAAGSSIYLFAASGSSLVGYFQGFEAATTTITYLGEPNISSAGKNLTSIYACDNVKCHKAVKFSAKKAFKVQQKTK